MTAGMFPVRLLSNILALVPYGKPQVASIVYVTALQQWLPGRANFTGLEPYCGLSTRTDARWFTWSFPFPRLTVAALRAAHPRLMWELLVLDAGACSAAGACRIPTCTPSAAKASILTCATNIT